MTRRSFIQNSLIASTGLTAGCQSWQRESGDKFSEPVPCQPEAWEKHGIILEASETWEGNHIQNFTVRSEAIANDGWRFWYSVSDAQIGYSIAYADGIPGKRLKKVRAAISDTEAANVDLSIGNLPKGWKPVQATHLRLRNGQHRLYFWAHGPQVCRYLVAESNDGKRYRVSDPLHPILYHPKDRAAFGVPSPDGIMYRKEKSPNRPKGEPIAVTRLISNDATTIYQLQDGTFELYSVALVRVPPTSPAYIAADNAPGLIRVIDRYTSPDGIHFETRHRVVQQDENDPFDQQFYYLSVTETPRGRV